MRNVKDEARGDERHHGLAALLADTIVELMPDVITPW